MNLGKAVFFFLTQTLTLATFGMVSHGYVIKPAPATQAEQKATHAGAKELVTFPAFIQFQRDVKKQTTDRLKLYAEQDEDLKLKEAARKELLEREKPSS